MSDLNRRKALKALSIVTPAVWSKPLIDAVILPAHAQTTTGCSDIVTLPGRSRSCSSAQGPNTVLYTFGINNSCLEFSEEQNPNINNVFPLNANQLYVYDDNNGAAVSASAVSLVTSLPAYSVACPQVPGPVPAPANPALQLTVDGIPYEASLTVTFIASSIEMSQITVAPA